MATRFFVALAITFVASKGFAAGDGTNGSVARVVPHHGVPVLEIDSAPVTIPSYSNYCVNARYVGQFAGSGTVLFDFPGTASAWDGGGVPATWESPTTWNYSAFDQSFSTLLAANPKAVIIPRIYIGTPSWWLEAHPDQLEVTENGTPLYREKGARPSAGPFPSLASTVWRNDMGLAIERLIDHIAAQGWINNVVGFKISGLMTEEWYHWSSGGNSELTGYSPVTTEAFQTWLRKRYAGDINILRSSWNDSEVRFDTAAVPTAAMRRAFEGVHTFRDPEREQSVIDWYRFYNELIPDTMNDIAGYIKRKTGGTKIVGGFYGFLYAFRGNPEFGHNALSAYYTAPNLDFIYATASYGNLDLPAADSERGIPGPYQRGPGGADYARGPDVSATLHGKLWYNNNDFRTLRAPNVMRAMNYTPQGIREACIYGGYSPDLNQNQWLLRRHAGFVACHGMLQDLFDIDGGYYDAPELMEEVRVLNRFAADTAQHDRSSSSEILIVSDELSCNYVTFSAWDNPLLNSALYAPQCQLVKVGAPADHVVLDDLAILDPSRYKMVVLLNTYHMFDHQREALARFKKDGRLIVFCYAPGYFNHRSASNENMAQVSGIQVSASSDETLIPLRVRVSGTHPLVGILQSGDIAEFGTTRPTGKLFNVSDPGVEVLGVLPGTAHCTMALKPMNDWTALYTVTADIPAAAWRALAQFAGVHIYNDANDTLYANRSYLCIHANGSGARTIRLPAAGEIFDAISGERVAARTDTHRIVLRHGETRLFRIAP